MRGLEGNMVRGLGLRQHRLNESISIIANNLIFVSPLMKTKDIYVVRDPSLKE